MREGLLIEQVEYDQEELRFWCVLGEDLNWSYHDVVVPPADPQRSGEQQLPEERTLRFAYDPAGNRVSTSTGAWTRSIRSSMTRRR